MKIPHTTPPAAVAAATPAAQPTTLAESVTLAAQWQTKGFLSPDQLGRIATLESKAACALVSALSPVIDALGPTSDPAARVAVTAVLEAHAARPQREPGAAATVVPPAIALEAAAAEAAPAPAIQPDARADVALKDGTAVTKEVIVLCVDRSGSMQTPFEADNDIRTKDRTRLESVKQIFYGFRDQTSILPEGTVHRIGLVSYDHTVDVHTTPTDNLDCFEDVLDNMTTGGSTGIYKAIAKACDLLAVEGKAYPDADLRVVVLTDGQNNQNDVTLNEAVSRLGEVGAICDALLVGDGCDPGLRQLVAATEGDCFQIDGLAGAYETLESPAVISLEARRNGAPKPTREEFRRRVAKVNVQTVKGACVQRGAKILAPPPMASTVKTWTTTSVFAASIPRGVAQKRLVKDVNIIAGSAKLADKVVCFPGLDEAGNMISLKALVLPKKGPYAGRVIEINLTGLDSGFPFQAPRVNVASPLYHYAVSTQGGVCLEMLQYAWSPKTTLEEVLDSLYKLIVEHETFDPSCNLSIRNWLSELLRVDAAKYYAEATAKAKAETQVVPVADVETSLFHQYAIVKP